VTRPASTRAEITDVLERAHRDSDHATVLDVIARRGDELRPAIRAFHAARALLKVGQPQHALAALDEVPGTSHQRWHRKLRLRALLALGRWNAARDLVESGRFSATFLRAVSPQASSAALAAGALHESEAWGLRYRCALSGRDAHFVDDLIALILLEDFAALRARLALCGPGAGEALGEAIQGAAQRLEDDGISPDSLGRRLSPTFALAPDLTSMWALFNGMNHGRMPASATLCAMVWRRMGTLLPPVPIRYDDAPVAHCALVSPLPEIDRVADWIGVAPEARADWHRRYAAAQARVAELSAAILGSSAHRADLARRLPPVDWSELRAALAQGTPVILTACHASIATVLPLELCRSGIDVRVVSPPRFFANVPEYVALHYADLDGRHALRTARRMIDLLRAGRCIFVMADGQIGARAYHDPDLGVRARLPSGLWPLARRYGARVFFMQSGWTEGRLQTRLNEMAMPDQDLDDAALNALWHREVLCRLHAGWREDLRNIHRNRVVLQVTRPGVTAI
tara:strand:+ start:301 stop:1845 length:1545 start_codon:yes stop_codon:yes gene_type:complete